MHVILYLASGIGIGFFVTAVLLSATFCNNQGHFVTIRDICNKGHTVQAVNRDILLHRQRGQGPTDTTYKDMLHGSRRYTYNRDILSKSKKLRQFIWTVPLS